MQGRPASRRASTDKGETAPVCGREWGHHLCTRSELLELARGPDVPVILRITANELADRRPPLFGDAAWDSEPPDGLLQ
jgi:hypothetical protein